MALTQELGRFVAGLTFENLPQAAVETARTGIIDTVATMIAGAPDPAPQLLRRGLAPAAGPAGLYFSGDSAAAPGAAWINGTAGHALDYDDAGCHTPQTGLEAKFSMVFAMAASVIARRASLAEYDDAFVRRPEAQELMRRVDIVTNENYDPAVSGAALWDQGARELTAIA